METIPNVWHRTGRLARIAAAAGVSEHRARHLVFHYEWPEGPEHIVWSAEAPEAEVAAWLRDICRDLDEAAQQAEEAACPSCHPWQSND